MPSPGRILALDTPTLLACAKIPASTLNYWVDKGFCTPAIDVGSGRRATRYWTIRDLVVIKAIKSLREAGCSLQTIAKVEAALVKHWDTDLSASVLYYNGSDVIVVTNEAAMSVMQERGQAMFAETMTSVTMPIAAWIAEGRDASKEVNIDEIRARRAALKDSRVSA